MVDLPLHLHSLAEWNVHLSPELNRYINTAEDASFPAGFIEQWLSSAIKVSPAITVCRFNFCSLDRTHQDGETNVLSKAKSMQDLEKSIHNWLVERSRRSFPDGSSQFSLDNYNVKVSSHGVLQDVICLQISRPCNSKDLNSPCYSLYQSKLPPPLDTWYHRDNTKQSSTEDIRCAGVAPVASLSRKSRPFESHHAWRKGIWPPYPYGVVIVDRRCGEAVLRGADVYPTTGILCTDAYIAPQSPVAVYVDMTNYNESKQVKLDATNENPDLPNNTSQRSSRRRRRHKTNMSRGISLQDYSASVKQKTLVFIGIGVAKCSRAAMFSKAPSTLQDAAIEMIQVAAPSMERPGSITSDTYLLPSMNQILSHFHDSIVVQNLPSMVVAHVLLEEDVRSIRVGPRGAAVEQREWILDMCCAPGGKTSHVASLCRQRSRNPDASMHRQYGPYTIVACDKSRKKIIQVRESLQRLGCLVDQLVIPLVLDTTQCVLHWSDGDGSATNAFSEDVKTSLSEIVASAALSENDQLLNIKGFPSESFDRILLDPPCSAWGLRPKLYIEQTSIAQLESVRSYQRQFIAVAVQLLKPGGILTFSTCTILTGENENMVRYVLDKFPSMKLLPMRISGVGGPGWPGYGLSAEQCTFVRRFDPTDRSMDDSIGFFIAKFRKDCDH